MKPMMPSPSRTVLPRGLLTPGVLLPALPALLVIFLMPGCKGGSGGGSAPGGTSIDPPAEPEPPGDQPAFPFVEHVSQAAIRDGDILFDELFVLGDELFETVFRTEDGAGALMLPDGSPLDRRFSRVPPGGGRFTGPNGQACNGCHNAPFGTSAGHASGNVAQDPAGLGQPPFNFRNTINLFGTGLLQRLAEEMATELQAIRDDVSTRATPGGPPVSRALVARGISFGTISASRDAGGTLTVDTSAVEGVSADLVIRPFGWKGDHPTLRSFTRGASRNELGMEPVELVDKDPATAPDPDGDGVEEELTVGDITALTVYIAAQETPITRTFLEERGLVPPAGRAFSQAAARGSVLFDTIGCNTCHVRELQLVDPVFEEPTRRGGGGYLDADIDAVATGLDPDRPFRFHLAREGDFPRPVPHPARGVRVALFGDLKRHAMGAQLADAQATPVTAANGSQLEVGGAPVFVGTTEFLTPELWGVGDTGPWLHDGRAASLDEAIVLHGVDAPPPPGDPARSEAQEARDAYLALSEDDRQAVVTFLRSLVLFEIEEE